MKPQNRLLRNRKTRVSNPFKFLSGLADQLARSHKIQDDPLVAKLLGHLRSRSFGRAVEVAGTISSQQYADAHMHYAMNQLATLVSKVPFEDPLLDPESAAWKKFLAAEHSCKRINQRLRAERRVGRERYSSLRAVARAWIVRVIGLTPDLPKIYDGCDFGPGSSLGVHGEATHKAAKLCADRWTVTPLAAEYARAAMVGDYHIWELLQQKFPFCVDPEIFFREFQHKCEGVLSNKIIMVPKTAKVHRTIAIEPLLNGYVQKGVDLCLKNRLARFGLDLTNQERNQALARIGSEGGFNPWVSIDLKSASDTISTEVVRDLLPPDWFSFLNALRSPKYESAWGNGVYEKFTSMGNGFCFPLETLIFASLAYAVGTETGDTDFCVYGDDILVHQRAALYLLEILKYMGFQANTDKTFIIGPFRESCGADFFEGVNVRPYVLDFIPESDRDVYKIANGLRHNSFYSDFGVWEYVVSYVPFEERLMRPYAGPDDTALSVTLDVFMTSRHAQWCHAIQDWTWKEYADVGIADDRRPPDSVQMYGLLRGQRSNRQSIPEFTFRRKTRTITRAVPSDPQPLKTRGCV